MKHFIVRGRVAEHTARATSRETKLGVVRSFVHGPRAGFGFIRENPNDPEHVHLFFHKSALSPADRESVRAGDKVEYLVGERDGRRAAIKVALAV